MAQPFPFSLWGDNGEETVMLDSGMCPSEWNFSLYVCVFILGFNVQGRKSTVLLTADQYGFPVLPLGCLAGARLH